MSALEDEYAKQNPERNVAIILLTNHDDRVLMVRSKKLPHKWQPVGGGIENTDASPEDAILREVSEETGLKLNRSSVNKITTVPYDFGEGTVHCYTAKISSEAARNVTIDAAETEEHRWLTLDDALELPAFPATTKFLSAIAKKVV